MNRILIYITLIGWAFFAAITPSCSSEEEEVKPKPPVIIEEEPDPLKDGLPINMPVTKAINDNNPENEITIARLIVIKNSIVTNNKKFTIGNHLAINDSVYITDTIPVGTVDMFIIVNEKSEWGLESIAKKSNCSPEVIENKTLTFSDYPELGGTNPPIPMYRQYRNLHVSKPSTFALSNGTPIAADKLGEVDRLYAKVTLLLNAKFSEMANGGDPIKIDSISIKSMPKQSYLTPSVGLLYPAVASGYFNGAVHHPEDGVLEYKETAEGLSDSLVWYIPEHRLSDTTYMTYISVKASLKDNNLSSEQVEFKKIVLGDGADAIRQDSLRIGKDNYGNNIPINSWFITRNTHYKVNARIVSFDKMNESAIDVITKVIVWDRVPINDTDIETHELKVSQDEFHIQGSGEYVGVVTIETNYSQGWSVFTEPLNTNITFENSNGNYVQSLNNQTGTRLRFKFAAIGLSGSINVKAGPIVKKINLTRH